MKLSLTSHIVAPELSAALRGTVPMPADEQMAFIAAFYATHHTTTTDADPVMVDDPEEWVR